ncbi:saccharopine dehydrogenase family protein [Micromonospora sp. KLBMP9576]|uniref:saccharopine dehydrogenase family protein n=1 Tax=Micromonospora sp. KLBMP9576 TaxID=3424769 RepID=UPI003D8A8176
MPDPIPASGTVHWLGAGLSTGSGLALLADRAERVLSWARTPERATARLARLGLADRVPVRPLTPDALDAAVGPGDVVVSMLPAGRHPELVRLCRRRDAHFACSSYVSPEIEAAAAGARTVVLTEAGLDPGIDHLLAHVLVAQGREAVSGPAVAHFTSYCGGLPAVPNSFRYRFSWAPAGVLTALLSPARHLTDGLVRTAPRPWEETRAQRLGAETFEVYPNRDSLPFLDQYHFPPQWRTETFVRGTARLPGWHDAWQPVFAELLGGDRDRIGALAQDLADRHPMTDDDRDRVVLSVELSLTGRDGRTWHGGRLLDLVGTERESAMARCVSLPLAIGVTDILDGRLEPGLRRAAENAHDARRWLRALEGYGVRCVPTDRQPAGCSGPAQD